MSAGNWYISDKIDEQDENISKEEYVLHQEDKSKEIIAKSYLDNRYRAYT